MPPLFFILTSVVLNVFGQMSLKLGVGKIGAIGFANGTVISEVIKIFTNLYILGGLFLYAISSLFWIAALSKTELSYAYPFLSIGYILVIAFSFFILNEQISVYRLLGVALIIAGLIFIAQK
jgi:multidrug transporter EmrE-like cation transporter